MAIVREKFKFIGAEKFAKEVRKYPALYDKSRKSYMEKDSNYHSAKKCQETKIVFFSYVLFHFFIAFFKNKNTKDISHYSICSPRYLSFFKRK